MKGLTLEQFKDAHKKLSEKAKEFSKKKDVDQ